MDSFDVFMRTDSPESPTLVGDDDPMDECFSSDDMMSEPFSSSPLESDNPMNLFKGPLHNQNGDENFPINQQDMALFELEREQMLLQKLDQCCISFDFSVDKLSDNSDSLEKRIQNLSDLRDFFETEDLVISEEIYSKVIEMFSVNTFRTLSPFSNPYGEEYDPLEEMPKLDPYWPLLELMYDFFLAFLNSPNFQASIAKKYINRSFIIKFLDLFSTEDVREKEFLRNILHRIYGKLIHQRTLILNQIGNFICQFLYENRRYNGIPSFLQVLCSIIMGFEIPVKKKHKEFLLKILMPLYKTSFLPVYNLDLRSCVTIFLAKDNSLAEPVISSLLRYWPKKCCKNELIFLHELEIILCQVDPVYLNDDKLLKQIFEQISRSVCSLHFLVADRTFHFWSNPKIVTLMTKHLTLFMPILYKRLNASPLPHWNTNIQAVISKIYIWLKEQDPKTFKYCVEKYSKP